ncbi:MAG TPA: hypothetical protein ENK32_01830 [Anaerolineae bacterium]|nr:hypothetical protein [Anaerolineae bacterium]
MVPGEEKYQAYLLRLWREDTAVPWRATLENPHTGEQRSFANLEHLFAWLQKKTGEQRTHPSS